MMQIPLERVAHLAPALEGANVRETPVIKGVVAKVDTTRVAVITVAPAPEVVDITESLLLE